MWLIGDVAIYYFVICTERRSSSIGLELITGPLLASLIPILAVLPILGACLLFIMHSVHRKNVKVVPLKARARYLVSPMSKEPSAQSKEPSSPVKQEITFTEDMFEDLLDAQQKIRTISA